MVANVTVATTDKWREAPAGAMHRHGVVPRVFPWPALADQCLAVPCVKARRLYTSKAACTRKWMDKQTGQERFRRGHRADVMQMLGGRQDGGGGYGASRGAPGGEPGNDGFGDSGTTPRAA